MERAEFNLLLFIELERQRIFSFYDHCVLKDCVGSDFALTYTPAETVGYYKKQIEFALFPRDPTIDLLKSTVAHCDIIFTSSEPTFDFRRATEEADVAAPDRRIYAVNAMVRIAAPGHYSLVGYRKRLWSTEQPRLEGLAEYLRLII